MKYPTWCNKKNKSFGTFRDKTLDKILEYSSEKMGDYLHSANVEHIGISVFKINVNFGNEGMKTVVATIGKNGMPLKNKLIIY